MKRSKFLTIPRPAVVTLLATLLLTMTAQTAWADTAVSLQQDGSEYYVNMLSSGTSILTLNDASVTTFKVYDDGGKDNHYAYTGNSTLKITVPIGYVIGITGTAKSEDTLWDYWKIYKGHVYSDGTLFDGKDKSNPTSINVQTTGNKTAIYFHPGKSSYSDDTRNLELTVTLIPDPTYAKDIGRANVSGMESVYSYTGSELSASYSVYSYIDNELLTKGTAYTETITKDGVETEFKEEGYYTLTITGKDPYYGSQSFTLRIKNDSPELRQDGSEWFVNMPYSGTHTPTLDGNIPTFKIYDDGGKGGGYSKGTAGNFSHGADGYLQIHAPTGYQVHLTGYVRTESERASLTVYDGNSESASTLCENVHGTNSAANADSYKNVTVDVTSSGEDMLLHFDALQETWDAEGLILTASIGHSITVADGITHGSVSCDNFWIKGSSTTIPLTVTPVVGYSVNTVSYNDDSDHTLTPDVNGAYSFMMPDKPVSVNATFTPIVYSISYELAGGTVATNNPDNYTIESESFTLINPTRTGYEFSGWTGTGLDAASTNVTIVQGTTGNRSYTATWTPISYSISYNGVESATFETPNPATYTIESDAITLNNPTKDGYTFAGWTGTDLTDATNAVTIAAGSTGNRTFTATWTPAVNITLAARQAPDGNYWTTFYCGEAGYTIDAEENACAYTATYADGKLTLHKQGKTIAKGEAVIIVADNNEVSMTKGDDGTPSANNDLHGVDVDTPTAVIQASLGTGTFYVLGMTTVGTENRFGFHPYNGAEMAARKAFVLLNGEAAPARSLTMVFDTVTGISNMNVADPDDVWYSLDGRKLQSKPTASGVYVNNGRKIVIK